MKLEDWKYLLSCQPLSCGVRLEGQLVLVDKGNMRVRAVL